MRQVYLQFFLPTSITLASLSFSSRFFFPSGNLCLHTALSPRVSRRWWKGEDLINILVQNKSLLLYFKYVIIVFSGVFLKIFVYRKSNIVIWYKNAKYREECTVTSNFPFPSIPQPSNSGSQKPYLSVSCVFLWSYSIHIHIVCLLT